MGSEKPLIGRGAELARLSAAVERARAGSPAAVLLSGDAGVGKTRLLTELCQRARQSGATVVVGHCVDLGAVGLPYLPFAEALRQLADLAGEDGPLAEALRDRPALDRLITRPGRPAAAPAADDDAARLQLFDAVAGALGDAAEIAPPLLLVIEDLHWADQSTRDLLAFLLARLRSERAAVIATELGLEVDLELTLLQGLLQQVEQLGARGHGKHLPDRSGDNHSKRPARLKGVFT